MPDVLSKPVEMRDFGDAPATRRMIYHNVLSEARKLEPVSNRLHTLALSDIDYEDPENISKAKHKEAILTGKTLHRRLRGTVTLTDNATGTQLDTQHVTLAQVPHMTDDGTFVINGSEYAIGHQPRLRPGVFARLRSNGDVESHVNVEHGLGHKLLLDPQSSVFRINIAQSKVPLLPLLKALGASDQDIQKAWGPQVFAANSRVNEGGAIEKIYHKLGKYRPNQEEDRVQALREMFGAMRLDPEVTKHTLGHPYDQITPEVMLTATKKLIDVHKGLVDPDDRDHMAYQTLYGPEDLFGERMRGGVRALRPLLWKATLRKNLGNLQPNFLGASLMGLISHSGLANNLEGVNPAELLDQMTRATRLGEGGISSTESIPLESRSVQPSQYGFIDPIRTPESSSAGVDTRIASMAKKGSDGKIYAPFVNTKTSKTEYLSPQQVADKKIAFAGELATGKPYVRGMHHGKLQYFPRQDIDLAVAHNEHSFNHLANLIPLKNMIHGQRLAMSSRMLTQALPLVNPESPLVQSATPEDEGVSYEEKYGSHMGAVRATQPGRVVGVSPNEVKVKQADGTMQSYELHENRPMNRKTQIHHTPRVEVGQEVRPGDLLARSNFTDQHGTTALGLNLRTAYTSWGGLNYEDAKIVSESAAKRLSSDQMFQHTADWGKDVHRGKNSFVSLFPNRFDRRLLDRLGDDGIVKPGTAVEYGDPLVLVARERERGHNQISRAKESSFKDDTVTWEHHAPGVVTDVSNTKDGVLVTVKSAHELKVGDKLADRYGSKGVIAKIIPDDQMPHDADGRPYEMLENPLGVITRRNPGQVVETVLGKIAAMTGKPYKIKDFQDQDMTEFALRELAKHGMSDTEDIIDPSTGSKIPGVLTGNRFYMKLHHVAESKSQGRGTGSYSAEEVPSKGGDADSSKRMSLMDLNALLSHGAVANVRGASTIRGQKNLDYLAAFMAGHSPGEPRIPLVNRKFFDLLRAGGINPLKQGERVRIMAMTDRDVDELAGQRNIQHSETVDWKEGLKPIPGGLFDPSLTGGHGANRWSAIKLHEPMPNPVMEDPIRKLLGLTQKKFQDVLAGRDKIEGLAGPEAISKALSGINLDRDIGYLREAASTAKKTNRDKILKKLQLLKQSKMLGIHPKDWLLSRVPVIPPLFRPVSIMADSRLPMVADSNYLYKDLIEANDNLAHMKKQVGDVGEERLALYNAFKAVTGLGDPITTKNQERKVKGVLEAVFGSSPKFGILQRKLLGSSVDMVGRATITPNPDLDMDQIGLPEEKAWEIFKPFVIRHLAQHGVAPVRAAELVKNRDKMAKDALVKVMDERPVIATRAPVLHRYGVMAFRPRLVKNDTLQLPPLVYKGFGADNDGDAMNYHVPLTDEEAKEALDKMLPSRNLFSTKNFKVHQVPTNEFVSGLYVASTKTDRNRPEEVFHTAADAIKAWRDRRIGPDTRVVILE